MKAIPYLLTALLAVFSFGCSDSAESASAGASLPDPGASDSATIVFGIYTADKASCVVKEFAPAVEWLESSVSASLGKPVTIRMKIANDYGTGISDITSGKAHISRVGAASYVHAVAENPNIDILAMESKGGARTFKGMIAVHKDSDIQTVADLRGRSLAFGSPLSTIGRYLSQDLLLVEGISAKDLSHYAFLNRHDTVGMAVAAKDFDAGALKSGSFKTLVAAGQPLRKLVDFDAVTKPWIAHESLRPDIRQALVEAMLNISPEDAELIGIDGFLESGPEYYEETRIAMERAENFDPSLSSVEL